LPKPTTSSNTYYVHQVQQAPIEPHIAISWWDEDERLVIRTSTQVPFHVRRMVAPLLGLPVRRIRVIKPASAAALASSRRCSSRTSSAT
jgi:CO/xanthine dehydrogenase Mo-binding subunit